MTLLHIVSRSILAAPHRLRCSPRKAFTAAAIAAAILMPPKLAAQDQRTDSLFLHAGRLLHDADRLARQRYFSPSPDTAALRNIYTRLIGTLGELIEHDPSNLEARRLAAYAERRRIGPYDDTYITAPLSPADALLISARLERAVGWLPGAQQHRADDARRSIHPAASSQRSRRVHMVIVGTRRLGAA